jgi:FtsH-binding integral membrane protein
MGTDDLFNFSEFYALDMLINTILCTSMPAAFLRKVYGLVSIQLLCSTIIGAVFVLHPTIKEFVHGK